MTDKQPEPEYIITESQLKRLEKSILYGGNNYLNSDYCILPVTECRTRSYHPAPEQINANISPETYASLCDCNVDEVLDILAIIYAGTRGNVKYGILWVKAHDEAIRQSERENVLKEIGLNCPWQP